jgi:DNA-binding NtrC family response regulator
VKGADDSTILTHVTGPPLKELRVDVVEGGKVVHSATASTRLTIGRAAGNDLQLTDRTVSHFHLELIRQGERILVRDLGSANGTEVQNGTVSAEGVWIRAGALLRAGHTELRVGEGETRFAPKEPDTEIPEIIGASPATRSIRAEVGRLAATNLSVLVQGESGTGKEGVARAIHRLSKRKGPFVTVDCAALPPSLLTSELYGHVRGAFTGADRDHTGAVERADGGTLFLDEIGELPSADQSILLGVLERRTVRRIGDGRERPVDIRVLGATNRDLRRSVNDGEFRLDLYYRLAVVELRLEPLRARRDDIPALVEWFAREEGFGGSIESLFDDEMMALYRRHAWPGNVRELRNAVMAAVALGAGAGVPRELGPASGDPSGADAIFVDLEASYKDAKASVVDEFERRFLARLLERAEGNVRRAARISGMHRSHLVLILDKHGLR